MIVEESKNEVENGCFGRMYDACAPPLLGGEHDGKERAKRGEERGETVASIKGKESLSATYGVCCLMLRPQGIEIPKLSTATDYDNMHFWASSLR